ncbi:hydrogenase expression/synthesis hypA family protein [Mycolicibacterium hassiacum DSM 44199]|uniref:Hydrogenase maturation factor HypA n=1 Tax=Mycolicibacterium hassiacum (strain DSM 44199 / CIP 105218 / JCM 12690 / 3849) TaxID=1122247 RepID=K5BG26_MYCHD|nr:hydrogenase maturation nickel metallochaperone HypA [Mycolicibacterium hassiacum]EKF24402.1 hydrogenase expression/synthesis hypA family protein [Mycolicibacterium hassiacum DSM 44199]MBX5488410.1 hydrogenase maturation nickel metallochaperone HypA [Mycolicibacterium hassiacum]MDA4084172.1 hydrogenase expression protein HupH [Mycolicibacterium hassiacum DSM 44199]PZN19445.1 MAG: hydrogenase maturation nickel metallochaperone HypA [Mycolicibacterium hassiacum]VCT91182.1 hydrogenase nickel in
MHELSICHSMIGIVQKHAAGRPVRAVHVQVGAMRQIVPDTLSYCWTLVTESSELAGAELRVEQVPAKIRCSGCGREHVLDAPVLACPDCAGQPVELIQGDEFLITTLELAEV